MNKPINPSFTAAAPLFSGDIWSAALSNINNPVAAEPKVIERARADFFAEHPELRMSEEQIKEDQAQLSHLREQRERHIGAMRDEDLTREKLIGKREGVLPFFDLALFCCLGCIGIGGVAVALSNLATFIADSSAVASLTDHFWRALFFSAIPLTGSAVIKAMGAFQADCQAERTFYRRIAGYAFGLVIVHVVTLAIVFAPHKLDAAALQEALANGATSTNPVIDFAQTLASDLVLSTGLLAEMLMAPVVLFYAQKLHRAGRPIIVELHDGQKFHRAAIAEIDTRINALVGRLGQAQAEMDRLAGVLADRVEAALHLYREMSVDLRLGGKRAREAVFAKRLKRNPS